MRVEASLLASKGAMTSLLAIFAADFMRSSALLSSRPRENLAMSECVCTSPVVELVEGYMSTSASFSVHCE